MIPAVMTLARKPSGMSFSKAGLGPRRIEAKMKGPVSLFTFTAASKAALNSSGDLSALPSFADGLTYMPSSVVCSRIAFLNPSGSLKA